MWLKVVNHCSSVPEPDVLLGTHKVQNVVRKPSATVCLLFSVTHLPKSSSIAWFSQWLTEGVRLQWFERLSDSRW